MRDPILVKLHNKLSLWKRKNVSLGVRVTLINVVLNSIPLFFFVNKAPKWAINEIIRIQCEFLWCGVENKKHINWVYWASICKPKLEGGFKIKNCELFNLTLLGKWAWRILFEQNSIWHPLLEFRYGDIKAFMLDHSWNLSCKNTPYGDETSSNILV